MGSGVGVRVWLGWVKVLGLGCGWAEVRWVRVGYFLDLVFPWGVRLVSDIAARKM